MFFKIKILMYYMHSKEEIVKIFLKNNLHLDNEGLEFFIKNPEKIGIFLQLIKKVDKKPFVITKEFIKQILKKPSLEIKIIKKFIQPKGTFSITDLTNIFNQRYNFLSKILQKRIELINLISINKITKRMKKFSIIGIIRKKDEENKLIEVEDPTGNITLHIKQNSLLLDTVLGFVCERKEDKFIVERIVFPDIPLRKEINKTSEDVYCLFVSDFHLNSNQNFLEKFFEKVDELDNPIIFFLGDISSKTKDFKKIKKRLSCPLFFIKGELEKNVKAENIQFHNTLLIQIENVKIFITHGDIFSPYLQLYKTPENTILQLLKLRNFNPIFSFTNFSNTYLIDIIPDIIAVGHFHKPIFKNYKGVTILLNGSPLTKPIYWLINLRTREINKINLI